MRSKRKPLRLFPGCALCVILDKELLKNDKDVISAARQALGGGADMIQLRDKSSRSCAMIKTAKALKSVCREYKALFIVNDRIDVAAACDADGVHIGQGDLDLNAARQILGYGKAVGVSVTTIRQARRAKSRGADYLGAGPVFTTPIKSGRPARGISLLEKIKPLNIPFLAIGGIDTKNVARLTGRGIHSIAVIRAVCLAHDKARAAGILKKALIGT